MFSLNLIQVDASCTSSGLGITVNSENTQSGGWVTADSYAGSLPVSTIKSTTLSGPTTLAQGIGASNSNTAATITAIPSGDNIGRGSISAYLYNAPSSTTSPGPAFLNMTWSATWGSACQIEATAEYSPSS